METSLKLTADEVKEIRFKVAAGAVQRAVAKEYKVNFRTINAIVKGLNWRHV